MKGIRTSEIKNDLKMQSAKMQLVLGSIEQRQSRSWVHLYNQQYKINKRYGKQE